MAISAVPLNAVGGWSERSSWKTCENSLKLFYLLNRPVRSKVVELRKICFLLNRYDNCKIKSAFWGKKNKKNVGYLVFWMFETFRGNQAL